MCFRDESIFYGYDFRKGMWLGPDQQKVPRKGGKGKRRRWSSL
jgi:hypothetical protein